ncbi:MAG: hypothetical protein RR472_02570, partial [Anaerovoracaceae bacterium]
MRRVLAFILALILFVGVVLGYNTYLNKSIDKYKLYLKSENLYSKAGAKDVFEAVLDKNTILLLGSSEFNYDKTLDMNYFPTEFFNQGGYETNIAI